MNIRFLSLADKEVDDAVRWYEEQAEGLSRTFLDELDRTVRLVRTYPLIATQFEPEIRRFYSRTSHTRLSTELIRKR